MTLAGDSRVAVPLGLAILLVTVIDMAWTVIAAAAGRGPLSRHVITPVIARHSKPMKRLEAMPW